MCKALDLSDCVLKEKGKSFFTDLFLFSYCLFVCFNGQVFTVNNSFFYEVFGGGLANSLH